MPRRRTHVRVGAVSGAVSGAGLAAYRSVGQRPWPRLIEIAGGGARGARGGCFPDVLEPPYWPGHRGPAHSVSALVLIGRVVYDKLDEWQATLRRHADRCAEKRAEYEPGSLLAMAWALAEAALRFTAGLLAGVAAGYISHIGLDALTPAGITLI